MATIVKTKDLMIEVARQLFARVGFTNTTMNDIADASKKGRRTLYTYCLLYTSPSPRDYAASRMPSSA